MSYALIRPTVASIVLALALAASAQNTGSTQGVTQPAGKPADSKEMERLAKEAEKKRQDLLRAERQGIEVRIKEIARFRGIRTNQLMGVGLIIGLNGTGDSKNTPYSQTLVANVMKDFGFSADAPQLKLKNVAVVFVTATLPAFAAPGNEVEVSVQSMGDAKSLQGGQLIQTPLYGAGNKDKAYVVAQGPISIGGFQVAAGGNLAQKNHPTAGTAPGIVEASVPTKTVFDGKMYLELDDADITTAKRIAGTLQTKFPDYAATAVSGGTVEISLPEDRNPIIAMSEIEQTTVFCDEPGTVVIDERTGTIVIGSNVRLGPAVVAKGGLSVKIVQTPLVSQPSPFSLGTTQTATQTDVTVDEGTAQVALVGPNATLADLATIFQLLKVAPSDIIAILESLHDQGALKAKVRRRG